MQTQTQPAKRIVYATLLAGLFGFSGAGLAQTHAIEAQNSRDAVASDNDHRITDRLADAVDAYNRRATAGLASETRAPAGQAQAQPTRVTQQLSARVDAYNENASDSLTLDTWIPAGQSKDPVAPVIHELSEQVDTYNRTGGAVIL